MPLPQAMMETKDLAAALRAGFGLLLVLGLLVFAVTPRLSDVELVRRIDSLEDRSRSLTLADVIGLPFLPGGTSVPVGFQRSHHWLRVTIAPGPAGEEVLLRLRPVTVDLATLYLPDGSGGWNSATSGERVAPESRSWPSLLRHTLRIGPLDDPVTAYVKIDTRSPATIVVSALTVQSAMRLDAQAMVFHAFVFGVKGVSILMILLTLPKRRNVVNALFLVLECVFVVYLALHLGYAQAMLSHLPTEVLDLASATAIVLLIAVSALFHRSLMQQFDPWPSAQRLGLLPTVMALAGVVCILAGAREAGVMLAAAAYGVVIPTLLFQILTIRKEAPPGKRFVRIVYALYLPLLMLNLLTTTGIVRIDWFYRNGTEISALAGSTLVLALVLAMNRALNVNWDEQRRARRQTIIARRAEARLRRSQHVLTHLVARETQTSLVRLRTVLARRGQSGRDGALGRALSGLDDVIIDCLQADAAEAASWHTAADRFDPVQLTERLIEELPADVTVTLSAPASMVRITDARLFQIVLRHLLLNAAQYRLPGSQIRIRMQEGLRGAAGGMSLAVSNAIDEAAPFDAVRVFEKFYRGVTASATSGTGLGLFICHEIASVLGGEIAATRRGGAVTFHLWLPDRTP